MPNECGQYIETQTTAYPCYLTESHKGPHAARELPVTVRRREKWEHAQGELAAFHEPPQTTAERYTLGATPVPGQESEDDPAVFIEDTVKEIPPNEDEALRRTTSEDFAPTPEQQQQPGDQPLPVVREDAESVQQRIIQKAEQGHQEGKLTEQELQMVRSVIEASEAAGVARYGTTLQTFNGRDVLQDAIDEARDLFVYLNQAQDARVEDEDKIVQLAIDHIYQQHQEGREATVENIVRSTVTFVLDAITSV